MKQLRLRSDIKINDINPYILVTAQQIQDLKSGWKKPLPVIIQINDKPDIPWKINMMPIGNGDFYLYLHGDVRKASKTKVGDVVDVKISFDNDYKNGPQHPMPSWFEAQLNKNKKALSNWLALTPSRQKEILRYFSRLKSEDAQNRNLQKVLQVLSGNTDRFLGRTWKDGK